MTETTRMRTTVPLPETVDAGETVHLIADLPPFGVDVFHRVLPDGRGEAIGVSITASPSFEAALRMIEGGRLQSGSPFPTWSPMPTAFMPTWPMMAAWRMWTDAAVFLWSPWLDALAPPKRPGDGGSD